MNQFELWFGSRQNTVDIAETDPLSEPREIVQILQVLLQYIPYVYRDKRIFHSILPTLLCTHNMHYIHYTIYMTVIGLSGWAPQYFTHLKHVL